MAEMHDWDLFPENMPLWTCHYCGESKVGLPGGEPPEEGWCDQPPEQCEPCVHEDMLRDELRRTVTLEQLQLLGLLAAASGHRVSALALSLKKTGSNTHNRCNTLAARGFCTVDRPGCTVDLTARGREVLRLLALEVKDAK